MNLRISFLRNSPIPFFYPIKPYYNFCIMFQEMFAEVVVSVKTSLKEINFSLSLHLDQQEKVDLTVLLKRIQNEDLDNEINDFYYFDHTLWQYVKLNEGIYTPLSNILQGNKIIVRAQPRMSDQILANPPEIGEQVPKLKRSCQRKILEAFSYVVKWRRNYNIGVQDQKGQLVRINLDQSAQLLGIPRKSLQDYYLLLRTGCQVGFDFRKNREQKMGVLRKFIKSKGKIQKEKQKPALKQQQKQKMVNKEQNFFRELGRQLRSQLFLPEHNEEYLYDVLICQSPRSHSDQDMIQDLEN